MNANFRTKNVWITLHQCHVKLLQEKWLSLVDRPLQGAATCYNYCLFSSHMSFNQHHLPRSAVVKSALFCSCSQFSFLKNEIHLVFAVYCAALIICEC